ncbi:hypothetical protein H310_14937 [Aphanomyces invadans]|uniref:Tc1-like transposase DDE domain-containing protein n=1 Tax=Aphanomyces invadans TaxID=157072 RepID=A0A024T845_9STRA|nr:hypothetical protein H310_14937 [Aphanomyces invadans]ETV90235.1 hypothetical protein H310_14937 [Aphanomyces invadans]|eukprot:XP_008881136.1 hypothetical protein H310_14937 [Aphanomyces invadans]
MVSTKDHVTNLVMGVSEEQRSTLRSMSVATGMTIGTLHRKLRDATIERKSSQLKPLSHRHQHAALANSAGEAGQDNWATRSQKQEFHREGHVPCGGRASTARLRATFSFEGKIGMWLFVRYLPVLRNSRNRPADTLVDTLMNVDAAVYRELVTTRVVSAIKTRFPSANKRVVLQHDNATPHGAITNEVVASVSTDGWTFVVRRQPPNSPDLNVLDLGFFASVQSLQYKVASHSIDDVIPLTPCGLPGALIGEARERVSNSSGSHALGG